MKSKKRYNIVTLGCAKNIYDSENLFGVLEQCGKNVVHEEALHEQDIVVVNTCGFVKEAKEESIDTILQLIEQKKKKNISKLIVTGCLSERYKKDILDELPEIDKVYGTNELKKILKDENIDYKAELLGERRISTPQHYAYLKISEGCDRPCSFCAIPLMRGKHVSTPIETLVNEAQTLAKQGVKELMLIAQDLTYYGIDIYGKREISQLLNKLCDIDGIEWIRLHYAYPAGFPRDLIATIKEQQKICKYLDMPLQHINNDILKSMRRGMDKDKTNALIDALRNAIPEICLRTTLIVGYPGESPKIFDELLHWVEEKTFDRLGCFSYSHEEGTHAYRLKDHISEEEKQERIEAIMRVQENISLRKNMDKIGKAHKVLLDRKENGYYVGRTACDSPEVDNEVIVHNPHNNRKIRTGNFYDVRITEADIYDLKGHILYHD